MSNYIGNQPSAGEFKKLDSIASSFNGSLTQFDLDYSTVNQSVGDATQLIVSLNGIIQEPGIAYTLGIGGGSIVFASAPASGDTCHIVLLGGVGGTTTPTDGSVTASKLDSSLKDYLEETFTANGSQTTYTLTRAAIGSNSLLLSVDGILQPSTAYSVAGTTLTISPALPNTTNVRVVHLGVQSGVYIPAADSITSNQLATLNGNLNFDDNAKAVFGEGSDLQIYHDGGGFNQIVALNDHPIQIKTATENMIKAIPNGGVEIYHNNSERFTTTSTGIGVTGTVTTNGVIGSTTNFDIRQNTSDGADNRRTRIGGGGDVINTRGAFVELHGNEHASTGKVIINAGNVTGGEISLRTGGSEKVVITKAGNVGIGTSSPSRQLEIYDDGTVGQAVLALTAQNTDPSRIMFADPDDVNIGILDYHHSDNSMRFIVNNAEAMRINSSGHVMVGTTTYNGPVNASSGDYGAAIWEGGLIAAGTNASEALVLNRMGSDGDIAMFKRSGSTIGSIGVLNSNNLTISGTVADHGGLQFGTHCVIPMEANVDSNGTINLGSADSKFKDVYLSGGVYLGGTGSANKLDDYEEGSFTPFMRINNGVEGITYNGRSGYYTKIGNLVTCMIYMHLSSKGTNVGGVSIDGLPFTAGDNLSVTSFNGNCMPAYFSAMATNISTLHGWVDDGTTEMYLRHTDGGGNSSTQNTNNGNINNTTDFRFFITYMTP